MRERREGTFDIELDVLRLGIGRHDVRVSEWQTPEGGVAEPRHGPIIRGNLDRIL